ncbi:phosphatidylinositol-3,5-bisphosphate 5-phosphatase [Entophlyctis sp. JEL0112]|nr:phosphatidylinositol-3,5-bisphosphate 5-phosphatase [Entophlyctis sp. JEL0112]
MLELLVMIEAGNGSLRKVVSCAGIVGFVKFLEGYYIILITKRSPVALIGGHYVYHIDDTLILNISEPVENELLEKRSIGEAKYLQTFCQVDLTKNFYFSYTYDITNSLQRNLSKPLETPVFHGPSTPKPNQDPNLKPYNDLFMWNHFLLRNGFEIIDSSNVWCLPVIYGFLDQAKIPIFGHNIYLTLIARRSRKFAGARFLKRGVNDEGFVANEVETEQIVQDASATFFERPHSRYGDNPGFSSFLQHRGSIPLNWAQEGSQMTPKPPINITYIDPYFSAAALHFSDLLARYDAPIIVVNLVKSKEKKPRESLLIPDLRAAIEYLNAQFLENSSTAHKSPPLRYIEWDMARANKTGGGDEDDEGVVRVLERIARDVVAYTGFFHAGREPYLNAVKRNEADGAGPRSQPSRILGRLQTGITRTNCIDCLDRTNAAQFMIGKCALGHQLYALGVLSHPQVPFDCDAANILNTMYQDHGDTIALQYGGSHLVNTMETYRKIGHWTSQSRDVLESIRRYYSNSFTDAEKQDSINLFLGNFVPSSVGPQIWELTSDYYLHNNPDPLVKAVRRSYRRWWINSKVAHQKPAFEVEESDGANSTKDATICHLINTKSLEIFLDYYRPEVLTSFDRLYACSMNPASTRRIDRQALSAAAAAAGIAPISAQNSGSADVIPQSNQTAIVHGDTAGAFSGFDLSPFAVRQTANFANNGNTSQESSRASWNPHEYGGYGGLVILATGDGEVLRWLRVNGGVCQQSKVDQTKESDQTNAQSIAVHSPWWTTSALSMKLMNPEVSHSEMKEYKRYISQFRPASLTSTRIPKLSPYTRSNQRQRELLAAKNHPDYEVFDVYIKSGEASVKTKRVKDASADGRDRSIYEYYVRVGTGVGVGTPMNAETPAEVGAAGETAPWGGESEDARHEGYARWVSTGAYHA